MKKTILTILLSGVILIGIIGCGKIEDNKDVLKDSKDECCEGCLCGDTIELLKNNDTAWTLTEITRNGEYIYSKHSFINFNGTGKKRFAFYENDDNANNISEVKGDFTINDKNEIILTTNDKKKITCKLGDEQDLIAVLNCDNNFGIFTLQKQGTIELPSIIKDTISKTKSINIKNRNKIITSEKDINILLTTINNSKVWTGAVTLPSPKYELELFDSENKCIAKIAYNPSNYFNIIINDKSYYLTNIDNESLDTILID